MKAYSKTLTFFLVSYRKETIFVTFLLALAGLAEAVGVAAFLPFIKIVLDGNVEYQDIPFEPLRTFFLQNQIPLNILTIGSFIITAISFKAFILWYALKNVSEIVAHISMDLRQRFMKALLKANWRYFANTQMGVSLNAIVMETFRSSMAFMFCARFISATIQFLVYALSVLFLSWKIFLATAVVGALIALSLSFLIRVADKAGRSQTDLAKNMLEKMADMLQGFKSLRAMALENKFISILDNISYSLRRAQVDQMVSTQSLRVFYEPMMVIMAIAGLFLALNYGGLSGSELALMGVLFIRVLTSMNNMQAEYLKFIAEQSALWSLLETIEKTENADDLWRGVENSPQTIQKISMHNIGFSHGDKMIIKDVSIEFNPRTMTALIGQSGSGKTTLLDMLSGFYEPDSGFIKINDRDLSSIDLKSWRGSLGFVPQEVFLFNDTIAENIKVGRDRIADSEVWEALEKAGAKEFVSQLEDGIYAPVGENGRMLSGGQRQRIAIARAIVHKPKLLLLDEATSALDRETEERLLVTLQNLAKDMMIIFVSHNMIVQNYADKVYKIQNEKIETVL